MSASVDDAVQDTVSESQVVEQIRSGREAILRELSKTIVGQHDIIEQLLISLMAGGHCLITGAPGLAKTLLVRSVAQVFHLKFARIQFTPDLMPADITGTEILEEAADGHRQMKFVRGPIFANVILADEINRTPPKTQAALLEAMQEHQVTAAGERHALEEPFFVLATQNPIEMEGTYALPEAQRDRFMARLSVGYPSREAEVEMLDRQEEADPLSHLEPVTTAAEVARMVGIARRLYAAPGIKQYVVDLADATRNDPMLRLGASPRAGIQLLRAAKALAAMAGRDHVLPDDIQELAAPVLTHRLLASTDARLSGHTIEDSLTAILARTRLPVSGRAAAPDRRAIG